MRIPVSLPARWLGNAASSLDRAAVRAAAWNTQRSAPRVSRLSHEERILGLERVTAAYDEPRFLASPDLFFPPPPPIEPRSVHARDLDAPSGGRVLDLTWPSGHVPLHPELEATYGAHAQNRTAHARVFLGLCPRPTVIAIHGYLGGQYRFEERAFPVRWMLRRGFDVALVVLPFHALRARAGAPLFPGADPRFTIEGCRQSVHDLRGLAGWLRRRGAPSVGLMGMSLGGYLTSLMATLDRELSFAVPIIPLASFADFARDQERFGEGERAAEQYRAYDGAMRVVSPLARPSLLPADRVLILAAEHDRITPRAHADRLAEHFHAPLVVFPGGHLLQFGRGDAFREVGRFWRGLGLGGVAAG
jgi:pimeloyl-ACP methyl ester carboxylesterase